MNVQQVVMPVSEAVSWTVLGGDGDPIEAVETYLTYLSALERSPNTQRAYATSLKLWFEFLEWADIGWADVGINDVARFVSWLRAPAENVIVLDSRNRCALAGHDQSAPRRCVRLLRAPCPFGCRGRRRTGGVAPGRPWLLQAVLAPHHQRASCADTTDQADGAEAGATHARTPKKLLLCSQPPNTPEIGSSWRCWRRPGCGSDKLLGCATATS